MTTELHKSFAIEEKEKNRDYEGKVEGKWIKNNSI